MYITFETIPGNDPRLDPKMEFVGSFWHYTIAYIPPQDEEEVYTKWLKGAVISEGAAKAHKFTNALDREISIRVSATNADEVVHASGDTPEKILYVMNDQEVNDTRDLYKAIMQNYLDNHCTDENHKERLSKKISEVATLEEAQMLMASYYDFDVAYTIHRPKNKEFIINWE